MRTDRPCSTISPLARRLPFAVCANATFTASAENAFAKAVGFPTCETNRSDYFLPISPTPPATFFRFRYPYAVGYFLPSDIPYAVGYFLPFPISLRRRVLSSFRYPLRRRIFFPSDIPTPPDIFSFRYPYAAGYFLPSVISCAVGYFLPSVISCAVGYYPAFTYTPIELVHLSN